MPGHSMVPRKPVFDAFRKWLGRPLRGDDVRALDKFLDGYESDSQASTPAPKGRAGLVKLVGGSAAALMIATVALWEGKSNDPYLDLVNVKTVCYGETRVAMRRYTDAECEEMLADGLADFAEPVLKRNPELAGHPHQLAAAVSLSYNIGTAAYARSTVSHRFTMGDWRGACDAFLRWNRAGGKIVRGLVNRRKAEREMCLTGLPDAAMAGPAQRGRIFDGMPPERFRFDAVGYVAFETDVTKRCGNAPPGFDMIACVTHERNGTRIVVLPNPCPIGMFEKTARIACHELAHLNGWGGNHEF